MVKRINKYKGRQKVFYICQTKNQSRGCTRHSIPEEMLKNIVLKEIVFFTGLMASYSDVLDFVKQTDLDYKKAMEYDVQTVMLTREYNRYYNLKNGLLSDLKAGLADREEFEEFNHIYENRCKELEKKIESQREMTKNLLNNITLAESRLEKFRETAETGELTRELLVTMVKKIYIYKGKKVDILFRFVNGLEKSGMLSQIANTDVSGQGVV